MTISCIILASGLSKRYGPENKLLEIIKGKPLFEHLFAVLPLEEFRETVVVTAYPEIEEFAKKQKLLLIKNPHPELGISESIKLGLEYITRSSPKEKLRGGDEQPIDACMFCVCDQPGLKKATLENMINEYKTRNESIILALSYKGERGNPVIFPRSLFPELLALTGDTGGREVIKRHEEMLHCHEAQGGEELRDIDRKGLNLSRVL